MRALDHAALVLILALGLGCSKQAEQPAASAPAAAAPAPAPVPVRAPSVSDPVVPAQTIPGGVAVTGPHRAAEGVAGAIQDSGTQVAADTPLAVGNMVQVLWNGVRYQAQVLALNADGTVRIHYVGWSNNWDENAVRDRLKVGPIAPLTMNRPTPSPTPSPTPTP